MARRTRHVVARLLAAILLTGITQSVGSAEDGKLVPKYAATDLTGQLQKDKEFKLTAKLQTELVQIEGVVTMSSGRTLTDGSWYIKLQGCGIALGVDEWVGMSFSADSPDRAKAGTVKAGDTVTTRGQFRPTGNASVVLDYPVLINIAASVPKDYPAPVITSTSEDFVKKCLSDPKAGLAKYRGKRVELTGLVNANSNPHSNSRGIIVSAGGDPAKSPLGELTVKCEIPDGQLDAGWLLGDGQKIKVVGQMEAINFNHVTLVRCEFTELSPNETPEFTPTELANIFGGNDPAGLKKYGDITKRKVIFLQSVIPDTKNLGTSTTINFGDAGKTPIIVQFEKWDAKRLKTGEKVFIKAICYGLQAADKSVLLAGWVLAKPEVKK